MAHTHEHTQNFKYVSSSYQQQAHSYTTHSGLAQFFFLMGGEGSGYFFLVFWFGFFETGSHAAQASFEFTM